jgi:isochorismate hydrolase
MHMTPNNQTITDIEEALSLFRTSFDAFYEALKCIKIQEQVEEYDWVQHDESEGYLSNTCYEVVKTRTINVPITEYIDYYPDKPPVEF